jgi:hypothetical protein
MALTSKPGSLFLLQYCPSRFEICAVGLVPILRAEDCLRRALVGRSAMHEYG